MQRMQPNGSDPTPKALLTWPVPTPLTPQESSSKRQDRPLAIDAALGVLDVRTPAEEIEFQQCETIVREGWGQFVRVGDALAIIRDKRLFKNEFQTFEAYCRERWGFGNARACQYISAAQVHNARPFPNAKPRSGR